MVVPKRSDRLIVHLMKSDKIKRPSRLNISEESEYASLKWDLERGIKLYTNKMQRYLELKEKLGK